MSSYFNTLRCTQQESYLHQYRLQCSQKSDEGLFGMYTKEVVNAFSLVTLVSLGFVASQSLE